MLYPAMAQRLAAHDDASPGVAVRLLLVLVALLAIVVPALIVTLAPPMAVVSPTPPVPLQRIVPPAQVPPVEPVKFVAVTPDDARAYNATIPFSTLPNPAAKPFRLPGDDAQNRQRATDCLAAAVLYEAGDDAAGERAVAQVVINRVRHPAFPKTICGVVFQGSERSTGCQFTFTCDGALLRWKPSDAAWQRAQAIAGAALSGSVDKPIGYSTHYHTDWVVPYWSSSLDKVTGVETHLFFRWTGWWGTPPAFNRQVSSQEPVVPALAALSPAHAPDGVLAGPDDPGTVPIDPTAIANGGLPSPIASDPDTFLVTLDAKWPADSLSDLATQTCGERPYCKFMAWTSAAATPTTVPLSLQQVSMMAFSYLRDRAHGYDKALWNCATFKRDDNAQCMKRQVLVASPPPLPDPKAGTTKSGATPPAPEPLTGIHRKAGEPAKPVDPAPPTAPAATPAKH